MSGEVEPRIGSTLALRDGRALLRRVRRPGRRPWVLLPRPSGLATGGVAAPRGRPRARRSHHRARPAALGTYQPRRRILDWPLDVADVADHWASPDSRCLGASGGGPYASISARAFRSSPASSCVRLRGRRDAIPSASWRRSHAMSDADAATVRRPEVRRVLAGDIGEAFRQGHLGAAGAHGLSAGTRCTSCRGCSFKRQSPHDGSARRRR